MSDIRPKAPAAGPLPAAPRSLTATALLVILAAAIASCLPAIDAPFTFDEGAGIADNRALRPGAPLTAALAYRFSPDQARPLFFLSLWADARLFGLSPRPFRATNVALHLLCGLLVYLLLRRLPGSRSPAPALAGMALFLLHPLQSESVIYTWGRSGVLCAAFMLAALLLAPRAGRSHRLLGWAASLASLALALAAKEEAVVLPLIALVWWSVAEGRSVRSAARDAGLLAMPVALFLLLRLVLLGAAGRQIYVRSIADNILGQAIVTLRMIRLAILPIGQSVDHPADVPSLPLGLLAALACLAIPAAALALAVRHRGGSDRPPDGEPLERDDASGIAARRVAAGLLIAAAGTIIYWAVPLPDLMSERRAYLPLVGAAIALSGLVGSLMTRPIAGSGARRAAFLVPAAFVTLLLAPALHARAEVWADTRRLWEEAARRAPGKSRPLVNLGVLAAERGDRAAAAGLFDRALALDPRDGEALFNRSRLRLDTGDLKGAAADLEAASVFIPARVIVWINLGIARTRLGDLRGAEEALHAALRIDPGEPRALANLAEVLRATGRTDEALSLYRRAMASDETYAYAAIRLGVALETAGDRGGALAAYREALARGPATPADRDAIMKKIAALQTAPGAPPSRP